MRTRAGKAALLQRKLRQARILYESAVEMRAVSDGLFAEAKRVVDDIQDLRKGRPEPLAIEGHGFLSTPPPAVTLPSGELRGRFERVEWPRSL